MKTLPLSEAKAKLSQLVDDVLGRDERVMITRNGRPAAILVSPDDLESWQETIEIMSDPKTMASIRRSQREIEQGRAKRYTTEDLDKLFGVDRREKKPRRRARR